MRALAPSHQALALSLAVLAGYVDSLGFLQLGGVFVSFMSGNSTRLAVSLAEGRWQAAGAVAGEDGVAAADQGRIGQERLR